MSGKLEVLMIVLDLFFMCLCVDITNEDDEHDKIRQSEAIDCSRIQERTDAFEQREDKAQLLPSSEPEGIRRNGKYNLRKSLAWDSAFFTSAGIVLFAFVI